MTRGEDCDGTHYFKTASYLLVPNHEKRGRLSWYLLGVELISTITVSPLVIGWDKKI
jgi:hypothetical protein